MAGTQGGDAVNQSDGIIERTKRTIVEYPSVVKSPRHKAGTEQSPHRGSKEKIFTKFSVVERLNAHMITS